MIKVIIGIQINVILDDKAMVFADGRSIEEWQWAGVQSKDEKADMSTVKYFEEKDFMEALRLYRLLSKTKIMLCLQLVMQLTACIEHVELEDY
jgi:hypothetical protein